MMIELPFFINTGDGRRCAQVAMRTVIQHFLGRDVALDELDRLTARPAHGWTWTPQIVAALISEFGLDVRFRSTAPLAPFLAGEPYIRERYGAAAAARMLALTDVSALQAAVRTVLSQPETIFEHATTGRDEIETALAAGHVPIVMIDSAVLDGRGGGQYAGHIVPITGLETTPATATTAAVAADKEEWLVVYHESGPRRCEAHRRVPLHRFLAAMHAPHTDNDVIIVRGRR